MNSSAWLPGLQVTRLRQPVCSAFSVQFVLHLEAVLALVACVACQLLLDAALDGVPGALIGAYVQVGGIGFKAPVDQEAGGIGGVSAK